MRRLPFVLNAAAILLGAFALPGHAAPKKDTVEALMKRKLVQSQKVLEGIAVQDYKMIAKHADELRFISQQAEWKILKTPTYEVYSNEFRRNAGDLAKHAKAKNLDAATLSYVEMTLTCVKCHKHVREKRTVRAEP